MRLSIVSCLVALLVSVGPSWALPLDVPGTPSFVWENGDSKDFELSWDGSLATFVVEDLGTATYTSLAQCCTDTFDRVRTVYPGAALTFSHLALNTLPIDTVFVDNLDLTLLKGGALDNLGVLSGIVTLQWDDPYARIPVMSFAVETDPAPVPEPATLLLLGSGMAGLFARRKISA